MALAQGTGKLCLFKVQTKIEREISRLAAERIIDRLGLEKPAVRSGQKFDMPLIPKQEDFYMFPFRHISATMVGAHSYKATDFSKAGVLKKSVHLLERAPAYVNHNQVVGEAIGSIGESEWVNAYTNGNGDKIPGGIEAPFIIDGVLHPKLVRELSSPVSPIDSASVTTIFDWVASHEFDHDGDFYWHLGEEIDGKMVCRDVVEVKSYEESSLVWMGADPYAKMLNDDGEIDNIDKAFAYARNSFSQNPDLAKYDSGRKYYVFDCLDNETLLHLNKSTENFSKPKPENKDLMNDALILFLASFFGTTPELIKTGKFSKEDAEKVITADSFSKLKTDAAALNAANTAKAEAERKATEAEGKVTTLTVDKKKVEDELELAKPKIASYNAVIETAKAEAKRCYNVFAKGKPEKTLEDEIATETSIEKLEAKIKMWGGHTISEFGGTCNKCQSKDISYRSSRSTEGDTDDDKNDDLNMNELAYSHKI